MAEVKMRFPGGKQRALTLSYDDGVEQDCRLIAIMQQYGLKGTFNLNSGLYKENGKVYEKGTIHRRMGEQEVTQLYAESGMEVAVHGWHHPFLEKLPQNLCVQEIAKDRENLEIQFGCIVRGMAYPYGTYNDAVVDILKYCGIVYSRTVISTGRFDLPEDWLRLPATCHHNDPKLMELAKEFVEGTARPFRYGEPQLFYLWGHSYEFEEHDNWDVIETFASYMGNRDTIWYATNMEIYEYIESFRSLVYSMDGKMIYNPSAMNIEVMVDGVNYIVPAGKTLTLK